MDDAAECASHEVWFVGLTVAPHFIRERVQSARGDRPRVRERDGGWDERAGTGPGDDREATTEKVDAVVHVLESSSRGHTGDIEAGPVVAHHEAHLVRILVSCDMSGLA